MFLRCLLLWGNWIFPRTRVYLGLWIDKDEINSCFLFVEEHLKIRISPILLPPHRKISVNFHKIENCKLKYGFLYDNLFNSVMFLV